MTMLKNMLANRSFYETTITLAICLFFGLIVGFLGGLQLKFQVAFTLCMFFVATFIVTPQKKMLCMILWVFVHPLGVEKILYEAPGYWQGMQGPELIIAASDLLIGLLFLILLIEHFVQKRNVLVISKAAYCFMALFLWAIVSYAIHRLYYYDTFLHSTPYGLLHLAKMAIFCIVISSVIKTRADLIWVLLAIAAILMLESLLVYASFLTGEVFNFARLIGQEVPVQGYIGSGGEVKRAAGTLGTPNQQATYQVMLSFILLYFSGFKRNWVKYLGLVAFTMSMLALLFTFSRGSWLASIVAISLSFVILYYRKLISQKGWLIVAIALLAGGSVIAAFSGPIIDRLTIGDDGATDSRVRMATLAKDLFLEYPVIGVGVNGYVEAALALYPPELDSTEWVALGDKPTMPPLGRVELAGTIKPNGEKMMLGLPVHNKYLQTASELGAVGLIIWLLMLFFFYQDFRSCLKKGVATSTLYTGIAGIAVLCVVSLYMMLDLFSNDTSVINAIFPLLVMSAAAKIAKNNNH